MWACFYDKITENTFKYINPSLYFKDFIFVLIDDEYIDLFRWLIMLTKLRVRLLNVSLG